MTKAPSSTVNKRGISCRGKGMGRGGARYVYWLFIVFGSVLLLGRDHAVEMLKIVFCIGLPIAFIWACCRFFRLLFDWVATIYVDAEVALSKFVIKHTEPRRLKIAAGLVAVTVASFLYFAGLIAFNAPSGVQKLLLATP
jgi:hypothetical protein